MEEKVNRESRGEREKEKEIERAERHICCHKKSQKYYRSAQLADKKN